MRRKNLWLRLSSCTMAAMIATTYITPAYAADFSAEVAVESQQEEAAAENEEEVAVAEDFQGEETEDAVIPEEETEIATEEDGEAAIFAAEENQAEEDLFTDAAGEDAEAVSFEFGTAKTKLEKGTYTVKASLMKGNDITSASMAGSCIAGDATMVVAEDGSAKVTVPIQSVSVMGQTGNAEQWKIYKGDTKTETTDADIYYR